jgi:branched-chain amino acid transport system permease protein
MGAVSVLLFVLVGRLRNSTIGTALRASADMDERVGHFAISPSRWEIAAFVLSGAVAAFAGCVFLLVSGTVTPFQFGPIVSLTLLVTAVVGGMGSLYGAILAGVLFGYAPTLLANSSSSESANAYPAILAAGLALLLLVKAPEGMAGLFKVARLNVDNIPVRTGRVFRGYTLKIIDPPTALRGPNGSPNERVISESRPGVEKVGVR